MTDKNLKTDFIDKENSFQKGEFILKNEKLECYMLFQYIVSGNYWEIINVFTGAKSKITEDEIINNYKRLAINSLIYEKLSSDNPLLDQTTLSSASALDKIVKDYSLQICINVLNRKTNPKHEDYPCIAVAAKPIKNSDENKRLTNNVVVSTNYPWFESSWNKKFLDLLNAKFNPPKKTECGLGSQRQDTSVCKNHLGNCAEQHAVNDLLNRFPEIDINNIEFSKAIRPRTGEIRHYCKNCCDLFPNLKN